MKQPTTKRFDILGLGCTAVDDLVYVSRFPAADEKVKVERSSRRCGGLTGAALITAARLGARCAYAGCLGTDEFSQFIADHFSREGVDVAHAPRLPEGGVVRSVVVVGNDTGSRNIFFEGRGLIGAHDSLPAEEVIRNSKVLFVDQWGMSGNLRAARAARQAGVAVVADFEDAGDPVFQQVLAQVDHLILSEKFARQISGKADAASAALALWRTDRAAVLVTSGANGCWSVSADAPGHARHYPAFVVQAADTTGCGDVFHGAYAASLARGEPLQNRIQFAAAAGAIKASSGEIPRLKDVEAFLNHQLSGPCTAHA
jgi:sugar/nucleoside kinase (ribokinase family)